MGWEWMGGVEGVQGRGFFDDDVAFIHRSVRPGHRFYRQAQMGGQESIGPGAFRNAVAVAFIG